jgi:hypothetical protein
MKMHQVKSWVVYRMPIKGVPGGVNAVCEKAEWEVMEAARPGYFTLIKAGIASEGEAERLARGTSGDPVPRAARTVIRADPGGPPPAAPNMPP